MRRIAALFIAMLALALVAAGCGGGGDSTGSSSTADTTSSSESGGSTSESGSDDESVPPESDDEGEDAEEGASSSGAAPTKAAFIKEADQVCSKAELELSEEVLDFAKKNGIDIEKEEEPSDDQKTEIYEQIVLPNISRQAEELSELTPPKGDEATIEELTSTLSDEAENADPSNLDENTFEDASKMANEYGLTSCGG